MRKIERSLIHPYISLFLAFILLLCVLPFYAHAEDMIPVSGKVYAFEAESHYAFSESESFSESSSENTYGTFCVSGNLAAAGSKDGIPFYEVSNGGMHLYYNYTDTRLNASETDWHLYDDKGKKVDSLILDNSIQNGALILQTSKDQLNWVNAVVITNAFSETPIRNDPIYTARDVELLNGCFYRLIVVYEQRMLTEESKFLFVNTDKYDYKKFAEVYEFYAYTNSGEMEAPSPNQTHRLGSKVRTANFASYSGEEPIVKDDAHYGWELGNFFVSGYTDKAANANGDMVFLKNVGDQVTLWFKLNENINCLNGKENLTITADMDGYDQYFETPKMDFGRGVLIIRYTDHNNNKGEPTIYTNYLEANTAVGADTKVQLFEEGDYEVALDYEITSDELIDKIGHYRIFFKFSVRNGNCMVYPFDVATGNELNNSSMTENGFRLDLARSRYLKVNVKREILKDGADGLVEDTRFNGPAKDGASYTDEGIYTITVQNEYTRQVTVKKIYVGTNNILRAHMTTGLPIPEINDLVAQGASISDDGIIQLANSIPSVPETSSQTEPATAAAVPDAAVGNAEAKAYTAAVVVLILVIAAAVIVIVLKKKCESKGGGEGVEEK